MCLRMPTYNYSMYVRMSIITCACKVASLRITSQRIECGSLVPHSWYCCGSQALA